MQLHHLSESHHVSQICDQIMILNCMHLLHPNKSQSGSQICDQITRVNCMQLFHLSVTALSGPHPGFLVNLPLLYCNKLHSQDCNNESSFANVHMIITLRFLSTVRNHLVQLIAERCMEAI